MKQKQPPTPLLQRPADSVADDPLPQPPPPLDAHACCGKGCTPCVLDLQADRLDRYRAELAAWQRRHGAPPLEAADRLRG